MPALLELDDCTQAGALERVNYFPRQLLTVDDMVTERDYFLAKMRRHNRFLHGWGVVCGLNVTWAKAPTVLQIDSGYALSPYGDEIYVPEPVLLDLTKCGTGATTDPCEPNRASGPGVSGPVYIAIKYAECMARPVRAMPAGCACDDDCEYSRIRDSFQLGCLDQPPESPDPPSFCSTYKGSRLVPCPPCPTSPWVLLAQVTAPLSSFLAANITPTTGIITAGRRIIVSSAILQEQMIHCCCEKKPVTVDIEPKVFSIPLTLSIDSVPVTFTFSKALSNPEALRTGAIEFSRADGMAVQVNFGDYDSNNRSIQALIQPVVPGEVRITVLGKDPKPVIDIDNLALDGTRDGQGGTNATSSLTIKPPS